MIGWLFFFAAAAIAILWWLLHAPYRGVGKAFYAPGTKRRFLLTGCASGMGRHMVGVLLSAGFHVAATDVSEEALRRVAEEDGWERRAAEAGGRGGQPKPKPRLLVLPLDVTVRQNWERVLAEVATNWEGLDVCMNIAGLLVPLKIQDASASDVDLHIDVMVKGPIHGTQLAAALMIEKGIRGHIINVSSMAAVAPVSGVTLYAAAKFGCRGFSLAASKDLEPLGIAVTCLMPDATQTPMVDLQLNYDGGAFAYSGQILTLQDIERSLMENVLPNRPSEVWLSPRFFVTGCLGFGGMLAGVIHSSRIVQWTEQRMLQDGLAKQRQLGRRDKKTR